MDQFHTEQETKRYNFTNNIEGIEGGMIVIEDDWENIRSFSLIEKMIKMAMKCSGRDHKEFKTARFMYRSLMEIIVIFLFISYFVLIALF